MPISTAAAPAHFVAVVALRAATIISRPATNAFVAHGHRREPVALQRVSQVLPPGQEMAAASQVRCDDDASAIRPASEENGAPSPG